MAAGISFGHFNIVGGVVREDGPYVGVIEDRTPAETLADLYAVIEPARPGSEVFCPELLHLIAGQFGRPQYSLTGNLLQSLRAAQEHLRAWNKTAPPERQAAVGASCLAVSGAAAYLAQLGPAVAYLRHDGHLRRFEPLEPEAQAPLGTTIACSPCFNRFELSQGDTLLLVTSRFANLIDDETADLVLSLPAGEALPEIYKAARRETEFSALYLAVTGELRQLLEDSSGEGLPSTDGSGRNRRGPGGQYDAGRALSGSSNAPAPTRGPYARALGETDRHAKTPEQARRAQRRQLERLTDRRSLSLPRPALYTVAAVLALTLAGWLGLPRLLQAGREDRYTTLLHDAQRAQQLAEAAPDPAQKRSDLETVQADLVEARTLRPQAPELVTLQAQVQSGLQALDQVRPLPAVTTVADLQTTAVAARSVTELAAGAQVYVLDNGSGKVFGFGGSTQAAPANAVFESGKLVEGIQTGRAVHIVTQQAPGGQAALLYILDSNRRLFSLDDGGTLRAIGLANTADWKSVNGMAFGGQDLYILDSAGNQVWRYSATDGGFLNPPAPMLSKADIHDAAQISVAGDIYLSTVNGRLLRSRDGRPEEVKLSGIDHALVAPQPPVLDGTSGVKYVGDAGNQRIVAADANDVYRFQYKGAALQSLRAIALDPKSGLLYALSEQTLIAFPVH